MFLALVVSMPTVELTGLPQHGDSCYVRMHPATKPPASSFPRKPIWPSDSRNLFMADAPLYWP